MNDELLCDDDLLESREWLDLVMAEGLANEVVAGGE
jgi:hypothetical protein